MTKIFEFITELIGWIQIVFSPLLIGIVIGGIVYINKPNKGGIIIGISIAIIGLVIGIIFATRVWRKKGTISFLSQISSTPELDKQDEEKKDNS